MKPIIIFLKTLNSKKRDPIAKTFSKKVKTLEESDQNNIFQNAFCLDGERSVAGS